MKDKNPFFSVVVPVYNKEMHVARALSSVLRQSFDQFEVIVVCDPSTDNSNDEVRKFVDPRLSVLYREIPGPGGYAARNLGVINSKGAWIAFLDADDEWFDDHLEKMYELCCLKLSAFIAAGYENIDEDGVSRIGLKGKGKFQHFLFSEYLSYSPFYTSTVVCERDTLLEVGGFPDGKMNRGGDVDTWLRIIERSGGYIMSSHIGAKYFRDSDNMVTKTNFYKEEELNNGSLKKMIDQYSGSEVEHLLKRKYNNQIIYSWNQNMHLGIKRNFSLRGYIYYSASPLKGMFFMFLSWLPMPVLRPIHRTLHAIIKFKRSL